VTHQKLEQLIAIMKTNKLRYHRHLGEVLERGFSDEAEESFFEEVMADLESLLIRGVNTTFGKGMKETVRELTDLAVRIGAGGWRATDLEHLRQEKRNCMASLKMPKEEKMAFDLCYNVKQFLESTKTGMQVLLELRPPRTDIEKGNHKTCKALLKEIGETMGKVIDVTSPAAVEKYKEVMEKLSAWRTSLARSNGTYNASAVGRLRETLLAVRSWAELCIATGKRGNLDESKYGLDVALDDDLTRIVASEGIKQDITIFLDQCEAYEREAEEMLNNGTMDQIAEEQKKLEAVAARRQEIKVQFKNGEISRSAAETELKKLESVKFSAETALRRLNMDAAPLVEVRQRCKIITTVEFPIREAFNHVKNNSLHIYEIFQGIDFANLIAVIDGNLSSGELEEAVASLQDALHARGLIDEEGRVSIKNIDEILRKIDENYAAKEEEEISQVDTIGDSLGESLLDDLLAEDDPDTTGEKLPGEDTPGDTHRTGAKRDITDIL